MKTITKENIDERFNNILLGIDRKHKVVNNFLYAVHEVGRYKNLVGDTLLKFMLISIYDSISEDLNKKIEDLRYSTSPLKIKIPKQVNEI